MSVGAALGVALGAAVVAFAVGLALAVALAVADACGVTVGDALGVGETLGDGWCRIVAVGWCVGVGVVRGVACFTGPWVLAGVPATDAWPNTMTPVSAPASALAPPRLSDVAR